MHYEVLLFVFLYELWSAEVLLFGYLGLDIGGEMNLAAGIQVAQLALKHRQNKKQQQRIIVFAGRYVLYLYV